MAVLGALTDFPFERPAARRQKLATGPGAAKAVLLGKKRHMVKNQIACRPDGRIAVVGAAAPGSTHDLALLRGDGRLHRPGDGEGAMGARPDDTVIVPAKATPGHPLTELRCPT
jgi:hypothetical protein